jgi:nitric oxide reductase subunit B
MEEPGRRPLLVSKGWLQAIVLVVLAGFFVLGLMAYRTYQAEPPIPSQVVGPGGKVVFTGDEVRAGQTIFLRNGLMEYGSIFGHGAYLGPDFTADYLHRAALAVRTRYGGASSDRARAVTLVDFRHNSYDSSTHTPCATRPARRAPSRSSWAITSGSSRRARPAFDRTRSPIRSS